MPRNLVDELREPASRLTHASAGLHVTLDDEERYVYFLQYVDNELAGAIQVPVDDIEKLMLRLSQLLAKPREGVTE